MMRLLARAVTTLGCVRPTAPFGPFVDGIQPAKATFRGRWGVTPGCRAQWRKAVDSIRRLPKPGLTGLCADLAPFSRHALWEGV